MRLKQFHYNDSYPIAMTFGLLRGLIRWPHTTEVLDGSLPIVSIENPGNWNPTQLQAQDELQVLQRDRHLTTRKVESMSFCSPPTSNTSKYNDSLQTNVQEQQDNKIESIPVNQSNDRRGVEVRKPAANRVRYDVEASPP